MKKTLLLAAGLFAATASWADVVDFVTNDGSTFKAYKIQVKRGPNGSTFADNGKGFMLTNGDDASDMKAYSNWWQSATKFYNTEFDATNAHHNFLILKEDYGTFIYSLGKDAYLASGNDNSVSFSTTPTAVTINNSNNNEYPYYIVLNGDRWVNFNTYGAGTGVSGYGKSLDTGNRLLFVESTYSVDDAKITAIKEATKAYTKQYYLDELTTNQVESHIGELGYPTQEALNTYKSALETSTTYAQVTTARRTFYGTIKYPEDGKVYYIEGVKRDKATGYIYDNGAKLAFGSSLPTTMPGTAEFYYHKLGERQYMFSTLSGKYLMYQTDNESGLESTYSDNNNTLTLQPMQYGTADSYNVTNDQLLGDVETMGLFLIRGKRAKYVNTSNATDQANVRAKDYYLMAGFSTNEFHASGNTSVFYTSTHQTSAFKLVEAPQPNAFTTTSVKLNESDTENFNLATYSSPFATTLPEGVKAYTVTSDGSDYKLKRLELTDQVLPAHTGVILAADEAKQYVPVAATTAPTAPEGNLLQATNGAATAVASGVNAYIFTKTSNGIALFGKLSDDTSKRTISAFKSYLTVSNNAAPRLQLSFDDKEATGIDAAQIDNGNAPQVIYDLSGRRVQSIKQAGVYIINGQKRVIK